jgi:hypothetical protein
MKAPKNKPMRFACTASKQIDMYLRWLLDSGLYGNTRSEVVARMLCDGIRQHVPPDVIREFTARYTNDRPYPTESEEAQRG